jgi:hypothetical protein
VHYTAPLLNLPSHKLQLDQREAARQRALGRYRETCAVAKADDKDPPSTRLKPRRGPSTVQKLWQMRALKKEFLRAYVDRRVTAAVAAAQVC